MKALLIALAAVLALILAVAAYFTAGAISRDRPMVVAATTHTQLSRESCMECHAPIAAEWRESFHYKSVTGPLWERVRTKGYARVMSALRIPCMNCHAPANVLDLPDGAHPIERTEFAEMGVDCVSCHVSRRGITGPGRFTAAPHEVIGDDRFRDPVVASTRLCAHCHEESMDHARTVTAWKQTPFAEDGVTCLHCHMPEVEAPLVRGGPPRKRRSHGFFGDKDIGMLRKALNASLEVTGAREAVLQIKNDRVGHSIPASGMNQLLVHIKTLDASGVTVAEVERSFGVREFIPGYLDFWPFLEVTTIPSGESREIVVPLPDGHGIVSAEFRYRDWFAVTDKDVVIETFSRAY